MGGLIPELSLALCSARSSCWSSRQRPPANFIWYLRQQVRGRNNPPSCFSVPGGPLWALDIWPGHTFPTLEHSICSVRKRTSFESVPFTDHKQEESSCRTARADARIPAVWLPTRGGTDPLPWSAPHVKPQSGREPILIAVKEGERGLRTGFCFFP